MSNVFDQFDTAAPVKVPTNIFDQFDAPAPVSPIEDVAKATGSGLITGVEGIPGAVGDIETLARAGGTFLGNKLKQVLPPPKWAQASLPDLPQAPTTSDIQQGVTNVTGYKPYEPQTEAGKIAGNVASFIPGAAVGGGITGGLRGAAEGALRYGVVPGVTSEAAGDVASSVPGVQGTGWEIAARLAGAVAGGHVANVLKSPKAQALDMIAGQVQQSGQPIADITNTFARSPMSGLADVNPNAKFLLQGIVNDQDTAGRGVASQAIQNRISSMPGAVEQNYSTALGSTPDTVQLLQNMKDKAQTEARAGFGAALNGAKPVNIAPVLAHIDQELGPGFVNGSRVQDFSPSDAQKTLLSLRQRLTGVPTSAANNSSVTQIDQILGPGFRNGQPLAGTTPTPAQQQLLAVRKTMLPPVGQNTDASDLHTLQQEMRTDASGLSRSSDAVQRQVGKKIGNIRGTLNNQIDQATGGRFKVAQRQYADNMAVQDAFNQGLDIFKNRAGEAGLEDRPEAWQQMLHSMSVPEQQALQQGARVAADQSMGAARSAVRKGAALTDVPFNRDKLAVVLGPQEADRLASANNDLRDIGNTNNEVLHGSQTQPRQQAQQLVGVPQPSSMGATLRNGVVPAVLAHEFGGGNPFITGAAAAAGLGVRGVQQIAKASAQARNKYMAGALLAPAGDTRNALVNALMRTPRGKVNRAVAKYAPLVSALRGATLPQPLELTVDDYNRTGQ